MMIKAECGEKKVNIPQIQTVLPIKCPIPQGLTQNEQAPKVGGCAS